MNGSHSAVLRPGGIGAGRPITSKRCGKCFNATSPTILCSLQEFSHSLSRARRPPLRRRLSLFKPFAKLLRKRV